MYDYRKPNQFQFSQTCDDSISEKMQYSLKISDLLNEKLTLKDYSDTIKAVFMIYQSVSPEFSKAMQIKEYSVFRRKTNVIELYSVIDYDTLKNATEPAALKIFAETFLKSVKQFINRTDFDSEKFYKDVEDITRKFIT